MKSCMYRAARRLRLTAFVAAMALAASAPVALAQGDQGAKKETGAPASKQNSVSGVVVPAPQKLNKPPPAKKAAFDAEAAKRKAWTDYRTTAPPSKVARARGGALETETYPGLREMGSR